MTYFEVIALLESKGFEEDSKATGETEFIDDSDLAFLGAGTVENFYRYEGSEPDAGTTCVALVPSGRAIVYTASGETFRCLSAEDYAFALKS